MSSFIRLGPATEISCVCSGAGIRPCLSAGSLPHAHPELPAQGVFGPVLTSQRRGCPTWQPSQAAGRGLCRPAWTWPALDIPRHAVGTLKLSSLPLPILVQLQTAVPSFRSARPDAFQAKRPKGAIGPRQNIVGDGSPALAPLHL